MDKLKVIKEFELMRLRAKLRVLYKLSLERPLTDTEFKTMKDLFSKIRKLKA